MQTAKILIALILGPSLSAFAADIPSRSYRHTPTATRTATPLIVRELAKLSDVDGESIWRVFRRFAHLGPERRLFFEHPVFTDLSTSARRDFFERVAVELPDRLLEAQQHIDPASRPGLVDRALTELESRFIARADRLDSGEQFLSFLGESAQLQKHSRRVRKVQSAKARAARFDEDPALRNFSSITNSWFRSLAGDNSDSGILYTTFQEFLQVKIMIARNLWFQEKSATRENVRDEYERILRVRSRYSRTPLFVGRNVVYAASHQQLRSGQGYVFARPETKASITGQAEDVAFYRPYSKRESDGLTQKHLEGELTTAERLTFVFEGHGRSSAIKVKRGISAGELAKRLAERGEAGGVAPIVIPATCKGHDFGRRVIERLREIDPSIPSPIIITPEEFGQNYVKTVFNEAFLQDDMQLGRTGNTTVGTLLERAHLATTVYVPDENNVPMQIL